MNAKIMAPLHGVAPSLILLAGLYTLSCSGETGSFDSSPADTPSEQEAQNADDLREATDALNNATEALIEAADALKAASEAQGTDGTGASPDAQAQQASSMDPAMAAEPSSGEQPAAADSPEETTSDSTTAADPGDPAVSEQDTETDPGAAMEAQQDGTPEPDPSEQDTSPEPPAPAEDSTPIDPSLDMPTPTVDPLLAEAICTSGQFSTADENDRMRPGEACVACHTEEREGPRYSIAGTLYPTGHEPNNCNGVSNDSGAVVVITDANGQELELRVNSAGNFASSASIATPYTARVVTATGERRMLTPQTDGDCNTCHTPEGDQAAPGRITLPF